MIEKKVEMKNGEVVKSIDENLVSIYESMGWSKVEEIKVPLSKKSFSKGA